jgi:hypothetical protein
MLARARQAASGALMLPRARPRRLAPTKPLGLRATKSPREGCAPGGPGRWRPGSFGRRGPGAVGHSGIVPYGARSPARSAAEGHAQDCSALVRKCGSALVRPKRAPHALIPILQRRVLES